MDWSLSLLQNYSSNPGHARARARGKIFAQRVIGVPQGQYDNNDYLDGQWKQISSDGELAIRGWHPSQPDDPFALGEDTGRSLLEMSNSRGVFTWKKR